MYVANQPVSCDVVPLQIIRMLSKTRPQNLSDPANLANAQDLVKLEKLRVTCEK